MASVRAEDVEFVTLLHEFYTSNPILEAYSFGHVTQACQKVASHYPYPMMDTLRVLCRGGNRKDLVDSFFRELLNIAPESAPQWILPKEPEKEQRAILQNLKQRFIGSLLKFQLTVDGHCMIEFPVGTTYEGIIYWQKQITDFVGSLQSDQEERR